MPDTPTNPHDEEPPSRVFTETTPSTLVAPTSGSETLVPVPEISEPLQPEENHHNAPDATPPIDAKTIESAAIEPLTPTADAMQSAATIEPAPAIQISTDPVTVELTTPQVTFGATNPALALSFAPAPDAPFQSSVTVGVYCPMPDARIFYTLDGSAPDQSSTLYDADKILLTQSATLSARAFAGERSGPLNSADYIVSKPLWQEKEPADPTDKTEHKISDNLSAPDGWQSSAASVRGKLHAHRALWREDAYALGNVQTPSGAWSIIAVSDGAGSAPLSRVGSNLACKIALQSLNDSLAQIDALSEDAQALATNDLPKLRAALVQSASDALAALQTEADARQQPLSAFAATLLILVRRAWNQSQICAAIQVGDGAIALDCASGLKLLGEADHGQHSSETRFLTTRGIEAELAARVKFSLPADLRATLVVSDGVSDDYFPEDKRLAEVFDAVKPLAGEADDAGAALLEWLGYEKKGSSDDRTIALSWRGSAGGSAAALEAELGEAKPQVAEGESVAGLAPSSNLQATENRLEKGASPAPPASSEVNSSPKTDLDSMGIPQTETDIKLSPNSIEATKTALPATPLLDELATDIANQSAPGATETGESSDGA